MIEILVIIWLCRKNYQEALIQGHRPAGYVILTLALWFGLEICGFILGIIIGGPIGAGTYILALVLAVIGGYISHDIVDKLKEGNYIKTVKVKPLDGTAQITLVWDRNAINSSVSWDFFLNGQNIGGFGDGRSVTVVTGQRNNVLVARMDCGVYSLPFVFSVESGGHSEVYFRLCKFGNLRNTNIMPPVGNQVSI